MQNRFANEKILWLRALNCFGAKYCEIVPEAADLPAHPRSYESLNLYNKKVCPLVIFRIAQSIFTKQYVEPVVYPFLPADWSILIIWMSPFVLFGGGLGEYIVTFTVFCIDPEQTPCCALSEMGLHSLHMSPSGYPV